MVFGFLCIIKKQFVKVEAECNQLGRAHSVILVTDKDELKNKRPGIKYDPVDGITISFIGGDIGKNQKSWLNESRVFDWLSVFCATTRAKNLVIMTAWVGILEIAREPTKAISQVAL